MKKLILAVVFVLLLTACGSESVATVGDIEITQGEFEFYLDSIKSQMKDTEFQTDEDWQNKEIEGKKAIDLAKEQAMDNAIKNALYIEAAKAAGITLTTEDENNIKIIKQQIISGYGSQDAYENFLEENDLTDDFIEMMCRSSVYYSKIGEMVSKESPYTDEEKKAYFEENMDNFGTENRKAKHILIATIDPETNQPKSQEEQDEAAILAQDILKRVEAGEDFDKLMNEYSEDPGLAQYPDGYVFGSGQMVEEFEKATDSVGYGEIAFCKSEFGYHIIKRLPLSYEDVSDKVDSEMYGALIDEKVEKWKNEYSIKVTQNEKILAEIK